jgi:hypothetical protein
MKQITVLLKASSILWVIWGIVHILAGILTMKGVLTGDISSSIAGIADSVNPSTIQMDYSKASGAIIGQHGFNLFWVGIVTLISAIFIWKGNHTAILLAAIVGGLADLGYFLFLDLGGFVNFIPGTVMTIFSLTAIITSFYAYFKTRKLNSTE